MTNKNGKYICTIRPTVTIFRIQQLGWWVKKAQLLIHFLFGLYPEASPSLKLGFRILYNHRTAASPSITWHLFLNKLCLFRFHAFFNGCAKCWLAVLYTSLSLPLCVESAGSHSYSFLLCLCYVVFNFTLQIIPIF